MVQAQDEDEMEIDEHQEDVGAKRVASGSPEAVQGKEKKARKYGRVAEQHETPRVPAANPPGLMIADHVPVIPRRQPRVKVLPPDEQTELEDLTEQEDEGDEVASQLKHYVMREPLPGTQATVSRQPRAHRRGDSSASMGRAPKAHQELTAAPRELTKQQGGDRLEAVVRWAGVLWTKLWGLVVWTIAYAGSIGGAAWGDLLAYATTLMVVCYVDKRSRGPQHLCNVGVTRIMDDVGRFIRVTTPQLRVAVGLCNILGALRSVGGGQIVSITIWDRSAEHTLVLLAIICTYCSRQAASVVFTALFVLRAWHGESVRYLLEAGLPAVSFYAATYLRNINRQQEAPQRKGRGARKAEVTPDYRKARSEQFCQLIAWLVTLYIELGVPLISHDLSLTAACDNYFAAIGLPKMDVLCDPMAVRLSNTDALQKVPSASALATAAWYLSANIKLTAWMSTEGPLAMCVLLVACVLLDTGSVELEMLLLIAALAGVMYMQKGWTLWERVKRMLLQVVPAAVVWVATNHTVIDTIREAYLNIVSNGGPVVKPYVGGVRNFGPAVDDDVGLVVLSLWAVVSLCYLLGRHDARSCIYVALGAFFLLADVPLMVHRDESTVSSCATLVTIHGGPNTLTRAICDPMGWHQAAVERGKKQGGYILQEKDQVLDMSKTKAYHILKKVGGRHATRLTRTEMDILEVLGWVSVAIRFTFALPVLIAQLALSMVYFAALFANDWPTLQIMVATVLSMIVSETGFLLVIRLLLKLSS